MSEARLERSLPLGDVVGLAAMLLNPAEPAREAEGQTVQSELALRVAWLNTQVETQLRDMSVPSALREFALKHFDVTLQAGWNAEKMISMLAEAWKTVRNGKWVTLQGPAGVGKTHLAIRWLWRLRLLRPYSLDLSTWRFIGARDWSIRYSSAGIDADSLFDRALLGKVIVIDDIGQEGTGRRREGISDLLACAYDRRKQIILTTNLTDEELVARYGGSIVSRIDAEGNIRLTIKGKDLR